MHFVYYPTSQNVFIVAQIAAIIVSGVLATGAEYASVMVNRPIENNAEEERITRNKATTGHTRCYCNLPTCISAGYMCMSPSGGCFSNMFHQATSSGAYKGRHGCIELLSDKEQREWCQINPNMHVSHKKKSHPRSLLYCCYRDLCNHVDSPETTHLIDESETLFNASKKQPLKPRSQIEELKYSETEVWFKAATIAVPICGTVIVLVLIMLAVRLLRSESSQQGRYKLGEKYVPAHNKNNIEHHYRLPMQKEMIPIHHNPVYLNHIEELQQIRAPLLVQNELEGANSAKNVNTTKCASRNPYNHSLSEIDGNYLNLEKMGLGEYAHSYPEVHHKNLFCDNIIVKNGLMKAKTYDKSNLQK